MHLILFFTFDYSLKRWAENELISRELMLYKRLVGDGHRVTFFTYGDHSDINTNDSMEGIEVFPVYKYAKKVTNRYLRIIYSLSFPFRFKKLFSSASIFRTNQMWGSWVPAIAKLITGKPLIVRCGYEWYRNKLRDKKFGIKKILLFIIGYFYEFISYHLADKVIITSRTDSQYIKNNFFLKGNIEIIRNYIDTDLFKNHKSTQRNNNLNRRVLYVGRFNERKNLWGLVSAIGKTPYGLDLIGHGSFEKDIRDLIKKNGYNVRFLGKVPNNELPQIINRYPVVILPSFYENNPKSLLEAMSCERIVIGTDVPGIREILNNGQNGVLCKTDEESIRNAIVSVFENKIEIKEVGKNSRKWVIDECGFMNNYKKEVKIYESIKK